MGATRTTCWTCEQWLRDWEIAAGKEQCEDCQIEAEEQAERDNAATEMTEDEPRVDRMSDRAIVDEANADVDEIIAQEAEAERQQRANWNAVADGGWPPYPSEY